MENLQTIYQQYCEQVRHHQDERRTIANTLIVIVSGLIALTAIDQKIDTNDLPTFIALIIVGLFGALCMIKCHGLIRFYKNVASEVANEFTDIKTEDIEIRIKANQPNFWKCIGKMRLWYLWLALFLLVSIFGTAMSIWLSFFTNIQTLSAFALC
ncbi:hypothetical protein D3C77_273950 [compost metagenome]